MCHVIPFGLKMITFDSLRSVVASNRSGRSGRSSKRGSVKSKSRNTQSGDVQTNFVSDLVILVMCGVLRERFKSFQFDKNHQK